MKNIRFIDIILLLALGFIIYVTFFTKDEIASSKDLKNLEKVSSERQKSIDSLLTLYQNDKEIIDKRNEELLNKINSLQTSVNIVRKNVNYEKLQLQDASDDDNVKFFVEYTTKRSDSIGTN